VNSIRIKRVQYSFLGQLSLLVWRRIPIYPSIISFKKKLSINQQLLTNINLSISQQHYNQECVQYTTVGTVQFAWPACRFPSGVGYLSINQQLLKKKLSINQQLLTNINLSISQQHYNQECILQYSTVQFAWPACRFSSGVSYLISISQQL
jgi:predicted XRE-type DNA-binding protein